MSTENALLTILIEKINNDTLVLPTLPAIALKVRKAADDPNVNLNKMGDVIEQDPSLSARIIKIANSAYLGRTVKVTSVGQAVTRIGLMQIKNIATALAMEQLFVSKNDLVKSSMNEVWSKTIEVVACSLAAHKVSPDPVRKKLMVDTLTLAALVHNIGVLPILTEAERHEEVFANMTFLNVAIQKLSGPIGGKIMTEWGFDDHFSKTAEFWRDLTYQSDDASYVDFVRLGAVLSGNFDNEKDAVMNLCSQKGLIADAATLSSDEFKEAKDAAMQIFV